MKKLALLIFLLAAPVQAQTVKLPATVTVPVGRLAAITVDWTGDDLKWVVPSELDVFREYDPDPKKVRLRVIGYTPGKSTVFAVSCLGGKLSDFSTCVVTIGDPIPPTPPTPPGPTPPGPTPPGPAPIPLDGFRVLMLYESKDLPSLPASQQNIIYGKTVRDYLNSKCVMGKDGKTKDYRIWDKDTVADANTQHFGDAMKRPRASLPWVIISNGKDGYEGPLPATVDEMMTLLKKYGGA